MKIRIIWVLAALAFVMLFQTPRTVSAQERHVVTIENGDVYVDGHRIPRSELPESLQKIKISANFNFSGDALIELNGIVYQLLDGKLIEADEEVARNGRLMVFFRDPSDNDSVIRVLRRNELSPDHYTLVSPLKNVAFQNYFKVLSDQARQFEDLSVTIQAQQLIPAELIERLKLQAETTARIVSAFPRIEFESYLEGVHEKDTHLYSQLLREQKMEAETHRIALEAMSITNREQRRRIVERLHKRLNEIFNLKQENRKKEIEQLSERLHELRDRLDERSDLRERIIESRLKELLGELNW